MPQRTDWSPAAADQPIVIMQIVQENNATTSAARKANAELLAKIAHDSSLVLYWPAMLPAGKIGQQVALKGLAAPINSMQSPPVT